MTAMSTDEEVGPRLRAVLAAIPRYVPGRPAAAGDGRAAPVTARRG